MTYYTCKREVWSPSSIKDYPDVLSFKKGNLYLIENNKTVDEEGEIYRFDLQDEAWFSYHFEPI